MGDEIDSKSRQQFLEIFKEIEDHLSNVVGEDKKRNFPELIEVSCNKQPHIKSRAGYLNDFSLIRNMISHKKREKLIIIPKETIQMAKEILEFIKYPPSVLDIFKGEVFSCKLEDKLFDIMNIMKEKVFTHIPVYSHDGSFAGVLSEASVVNWIAEKKIINLENTKVGELGNFLSKQPNEDYSFVEKDKNAYAVKKILLDNVIDNRRVGAIFITETGEKNEQLLGIITAWDLPKLD